MTIKHKCGDKVVTNKATSETTEHKSYNEHAAMHYEGGGWHKWFETEYTVKKCVKCGGEHILNENQLL